MSVVGIGLATFEELGEIILRQLTGKDKDAHPDIESALVAAAKDAFEAGSKALEARVRQLVEQLKLGLAIRDVADQAQQVPKAFDVSDSGPPHILEGAEITQMPPDWKPDPEGSSER